MKRLDECVIYTIGQGSRSVDELTKALMMRNVRFLFDVRRIPLSIDAPDFSRDTLSSLLSERGVVYVSTGADLGGNPEDHPDFYEDVPGRVDPKRLMYSPRFANGINKLILGARTGRDIAVFCGEGAPERCHRSNIIGRSLEARGVRVMHIDVDGEEVNQTDVLSRLLPKAAPSFHKTTEQPDPCLNAEA